MSPAKDGILSSVKKLPASMPDVRCPAAPKSAEWTWHIRSCTAQPESKADSSVARTPGRSASSCLAFSCACSSRRTYDGAMGPRDGRHLAAARGYIGQKVGRSIPKQRSTSDSALTLAAFAMTSVSNLKICSAKALVKRV